MLSMMNNFMLKFRHVRIQNNQQRQTLTRPNRYIQNATRPDPHARFYAGRHQSYGKNPVAT